MRLINMLFYIVDNSGANTIKNISSKKICLGSILSAVCLSTKFKSKIKKSDIIYYSPISLKKQKIIFNGGIIFNSNKNNSIIVSKTGDPLGTRLNYRLPSILKNLVSNIKLFMITKNK